MPHELSFYDLEFEKVPYLAYSTCGTPYTRYRSVGMPRIPDKVLDSVFYLYKTKEDAEKGSEFGGTGFLIGMTSERFPDEPHVYLIYGVTNWHVAVRDGFSVIRIKNREGGNEIFEFDPSDWRFIANGNDVAISPPLSLKSSKHQVLPLSVELLTTKEKIAELDIGVGEDIFMLGRFVDHDGGPTTRPAARFGNISIMPSVIVHEGKERESYCVDMHSRTGYSGSPVFAYRTVGANLNSPQFGGEPVKYAAFLVLLGVHWGQFQENLEMRDVLSESKIELIDGMYVKGASGMTMVCPAWSILDVLNTENLKEERKKMDENIADARKTKRPSIIEESSVSNVKENQNHREDFNNLLGVAVTGKPSGD